MKKKVFSLLLAVGFVLGGFSVSAQTTESGAIAIPNGHYYSVPQTASVSAVSETVYDVMLEAVLNHQNSVNVSRFNIPSSAAVTVYYNFLYDNPETFVIKGGNRYEFAGKVTTYTFSYYDSAAVANQKIACYHAELDKIVATVPQNLTDLEKVLYVHDYLATHFEYDRTYSIYDVYNFLTQGTGVCESYGKTFMAIMRQLGIEAYNVSSSTANHLWNVVKVDGSFYHIDVTFDDPIADRTGRVNHDYFLLSTDALLALDSDRSDWEVYGNSVTCNSDLYATGYAWSNSKCQMVYLDETWYVFDGNVLYSVGSDMQTKTQLYTQNQKRWYLYNSTSFWTGYYGSMFAIGDTIYGNTQLGVWYYQPNSGSSGYLSIDQSVEEESIYGSIYVGEGILKLQYCEDANDSTDREVLMDCALLTDENRSYAGALVNIQSMILNGDISRDELLDVNDDGVVDIFDLVRMKKRAAA